MSVYVNNGNMGQPDSDPQLDFTSESRNKMATKKAPQAPLDKYAKSVGKSAADSAVFTQSEQAQQHTTEPEKNNTEISWDSPTNRRTLDQRAKQIGRASCRERV